MSLKYFSPRHWLRSFSQRKKIINETLLRLFPIFLRPSIEAAQGSKPAVVPLIPSEKRQAIHKILTNPLITTNNCNVQQDFTLKA